MSQSQSQSQFNLNLQALTQYMIANGCVSENNFKAFLSNLLSVNEEDLTDEKVSQAVTRANRKLNKFNIMIRASMDEVLAKRYYILISTVDNHITRAAHHHTPKQFEFFKLLMNAIVSNPRGIVDESILEQLANMTGIPIRSKIRSLLPEHKILFNDWCNKKWFMIVSERGESFITLGVRAMAELDVFIKQKLVERPDDLDCKNCNTISIYSVICGTCESRYHKRCAKMCIEPGTNNCKVCSRPGTSDRQ